MNIHTGSFKYVQNYLALQDYVLNPAEPYIYIRDITTSCKNNNKKITAVGDKIL